MKRYLLDSNVLIQLVNKTPGYGLVESRLGSAQAHSVLVSAVTVWEIFRRAEMGKAPAKAAKAALAMLSEFNVVPFTREAAALGGSIYATLAKLGTTIGEQDSMIAGSAMAMASRWLPTTPASFRASRAWCWRTGAGHRARLPSSAPSGPPDQGAPASHAPIPAKRLCDSNATDAD